MKLSQTGSVAPVLHLESDDGLHVYGSIEEAVVGEIDRRTLSARGLLTAAVVQTVNDMFRTLDLRRRQEPDIGARMQLKGGAVGGTVTFMDRESRTLRFGDGEALHSWDDVEYSS